MNSNAELSAITALDLDQIKLKLMHKESGEGWSLAQANAVEIEYRRFLHLLKQFPDEQVAPRSDVDIFWHYHILDTMKYAADCEQIFGYFLHHYPYSGLGGEDEQADHHRTGARSIELYEATFGKAGIRHEESHAATALLQPASNQAVYCTSLTAPNQTAYCTSTKAKAVLNHRAYCTSMMVPTHAAYCTSMKASNQAAYCTSMKPSIQAAYCTSMKASNQTAYCTSMQPSDQTAYCTSMNRPFKQITYCTSMPAKAAWPRVVAQNDSVYLQQELAQAA